MLPFRSGPIGFLGTNIRRMLNRIVVGTKHKPSRGGSKVARMHGTVRVRVYSTWKWCACNAMHTCPYRSEQKPGGPPEDRECLLVVFGRKPTKRPPPSPLQPTMTYLLALSLLAASLAAAGVWSPPPQPAHHRVVKEGQRVIVVEYEREDLGSPDQAEVLNDDHCSNILPSLHEVEEKAREKFKEAASVLPNVGQGASYVDRSGQEETPSGSSTTKERICDAYGKCKEKISSMFGRAKDKTSDVGDWAAEVGEEVASRAKRVGEEVEGRAKEKTRTAHETVKGATETAAETVRLTSDKAKSIGEKIEGEAKEAYDKAKEAYDKAKEAKETAADKAKLLAKKAAEEVEGAADTVKTMGKDVAGNITKAAETTAKDLTEIGRQAMAVARDAWACMSSPESLRMMAGVGHLLAFSATYGTCMWVTFVSSHLLAGSLPRHQFGLVQSRIYPVYFRAMAYGIGLALLGHLLSKKGRPRVGLPGYNLLASLAFVLVNSLCLEPRASKVMFKRLKLEKEEGNGRDVADLTPQPMPPVSVAATTTSTRTTTEANSAGRRTTVAAARTAGQEAVKSKMATLNGRLKNLNTYSSFFNVLALMGLTWHLVYLAQRLQMGC